MGNVFANHTEDFFFSEMKKTKTSLIVEPNYVPGRSTSNIKLQSWYNL